MVPDQLKAWSEEHRRLWDARQWDAVMAHLRTSGEDDLLRHIATEQASRDAPREPAYVD
jgi:hypothetical protein